MRVAPAHAFEGGDVDEPAVGMRRLRLVRGAGGGGEHVRVRLCAIEDTAQRDVRRNKAPRVKIRGHTEVDGGRGFHKKK